MSCDVVRPGGEPPPGEGGAGQGRHAGAAGPAALPGEVHLRGVCGGNRQLRGGHQPAAGPPGLEPGERGRRRGHGRGSGEAAGRLRGAAAFSPTPPPPPVAAARHCSSKRSDSSSASVSEGWGRGSPSHAVSKPRDQPLNVPERRLKRFHSAERLI